MDNAEWFLFESDERNTYWSALEDLIEDDDGDFLPDAVGKSTKFWMSVRTDRPAPDLFFAPGTFYVFSDSARAVVASFRLPADAVWKSFEIRYTSRPAATHHCLILPSRVDVLNRKLSDFKWLVPNKVVGDVRKWVLREVALPNLDLFKAECQNWICSRPLRDAVVAAGLTAISLLSLETD